MNDLLRSAADRAVRYLENLDDRPVWPPPEALSQLATLAREMPDESRDPAETLALLDTVAGPATVASAGRRYFGFVTGGALPITVAANWLAAAWDQNGALYASSPAAAALEDVALRWLVELLNLPQGSGGAFVTGATMANFTALAAARHALLARHGWDVEAQGLFGAPPVMVVVSDEVHVSVLKALTMLGFGRERVMRVPVDGQGRMRPAALPTLSDPAIVCIQAGNVNTGAFDPARALCDVAHQADAWVHVDGAFGLWAAAAPARAGLVDGVADADSWAVDAHKWLNVPYDSGVALVRESEHLAAAMSAHAAYLLENEMRQPAHFTPEFSRRARATEIWAALHTLGRAGVGALVERNCRYAARFAAGLRAAGYDVLNEVVLNQVLVSFGDAARTQRVIAAVQSDGNCWCGGSEWQGHTAMRISVSSWATTEADVERSLAAILRAASYVD